MVEQIDKVQKLEGLRQEKRYQEVLDNFRPGEIIGDPRILPICFDAARGLVKRSFSVDEIRDTFKQLDGIADGYWNNAGYAWMIDEKTDLSVSYRRNLSRFFWEIAPAISSWRYNFRNDSYSMLESAQLIIPENHWLSSLMDVEKLNRHKNNIFINRVNLNDVLEAFNGVITSPDSNPDANKAVLDWSLETVFAQPFWRWLESIKIFLAIEDSNRKINRNEKLGLFNTFKRLIHEQIHEGVIDLSRWTLKAKDREFISSRLLAVSEAWITKETLESRNS